MSDRENRLIHLTAYRQLPPALQSVVRMHLIDGIPGPRAVGLMNLPNPTRTWESERVQRCITDFRAGVDNSEDWVARLAAVKQLDKPDPIPVPAPQTVRPQTDENPTPLKCHTVDTFEKAESPRFDMSNRPAEHGSGIPLNRPETAQPSDPARCPRCGLVLCGCHRGERAPTRPNEIVLGGAESGVDVLDLFPGITPQNVQWWGDQQRDDADERERLIREFQDRQEREAEQTANELSKITPSSRLIGRR